MLNFNLKARTEITIIMVERITLSKSMFVIKSQFEMKQVYKVGEKIGQGAFGEIRLCTHRETKDRRIVKVYNKRKMDIDETE